MAGFRTFATGEVLTAANVNDFLMGQATMTFADAAARDTALTGILRAGLNVYLEDTDRLQYYNGTAWENVPNEADVDAAGNAFDTIVVITASNNSFAVPALGNSIVKVTVIGGGGGGGGSSDGGTGGTTILDAGSAGTVTASGGPGGIGGSRNDAGRAGTAGLAAGNHGLGGARVSNTRYGGAGGGGAITVSYLNLDGISALDVTIGAGGTGGPNGSVNVGGNGGRGEIQLELKAA